MIASKYFLLVRILSPAEFAPVATALLFAAIAEGLTEFGFGAALVQRRDTPSVKEVKSLFMPCVLRGLLVSMAALAFGAIMASSMAERSVLGPVAVIGLMAIARGAGALPYAMAARELKFGMIAKIEIGVRFLETVAVAVIATLGNYPVAIVAAFVATEYIRLILGHYMLFPCISTKPDWRTARSFLPYSRWMWASSLATVAANQTDKILAGLVAGPIGLAQYQIANRISQYGIADPALMVGKIFFPHLAERRRNNHDRALIFLRDSLALIGGLAFIAAIGLAATSPFLIKVLLGSRWLDALPYFEIVPFTMALGACIVPLVSWHKSDSSPKAPLWATLIQLPVFSILAVTLGWTLGTIGFALAALAGVASAFLALVCCLPKSERLGIFCSLASVMGFALLSNLPEMIRPFFAGIPLYWPTALMCIFSATVLFMWYRRRN